MDVDFNKFRTPQKFEEMEVQTDESHENAQKLYLTIENL